MTKVLATALLTLGSAAILTSCGGGGTDSIPDGLGGSGSSSGGKDIKIKSLKLETQNGIESNPVIYPDDVFYIKWNVDYSGSSNYGIAFFATSTDSKPTIENSSDYFAHNNCGTGVLDCSKGLKCHYFQNQSNSGYFIECAVYSTIPGYEGWGNYQQPKRIDPYSVNYISADTYMYVFKLNGNSVDTSTLHSTKSIPVTFSP